MTKTMEICKVRNGERFIVDGEEFVKLGDIAGGAFVLLADTLPDYCAFESEDADDDRDHNNFIGSNVQRVVDAQSQGSLRSGSGASHRPDQHGRHDRLWNA